MVLWRHTDFFFFQLSNKEPIQISRGLTLVCRAHCYFLLQPYIECNTQYVGKHTGSKGISKNLIKEVNSLDKLDKAENLFIFRKKGNIRSQSSREKKEVLQKKKNIFTMKGKFLNYKSWCSNY